MPISAFIFIKTSGLLRTINVHVKCLGFIAAVQGLPGLFNARHHLPNTETFWTMSIKGGQNDRFSVFCKEEQGFEST